MVDRLVSGVGISQKRRNDVGAPRSLLKRTNQIAEFERHKLVVLEKKSGPNKVKSQNFLIRTNCIRLL
jgi:hypothetical protein